MAGYGKIWEVKTEPSIPVVGRIIKLLVSIKNVGTTSGTLWINVTVDEKYGINHRKVGIPPGARFNWFTCTCGTFTGTPKFIHIEVGSGSYTNQPHDTFDGIIATSEELHYIAGPDIPQTNYKLTTHVSGEGAVQIHPPFGPYAPGTEVSIYAVRQYGWKFKVWSGDLATTRNPVTIVMDNDKDITANYEKISSGGRIVRIGP